MLYGLAVILIFMAAAAPTVSQTVAAFMAALVVGMLGRAVKYVVQGE